MMETNRLPKFKAQYRDRPFALEERDLSILQTVYEYGVINSSHLRQLFQYTLKEPPVKRAPTWQKEAAQTGEGIIRRLNLLFHYGYLDRPREQVSLQRQVGNIPMIYALSDRGARSLREAGHEIPASANPTSRRKNNSSLSYRTLNHQLIVSDFITTLRLALSSDPLVSFVQWQREHTLHALHVPIEYATGSSGQTQRTTVTVRPDAIFSIRFADKPEGNNTANFFLEADTGTMSNVEYFKKIHAYWRLHLNREYLQRFGVKEFRVITTTSSPARRDNLRKFIVAKWQQMRTPPSVKDDYPRFLFTDHNAYELAKPKTMLGAIFYTLKDDPPRAIVPQRYIAASNENTVS